ncbi:class I SAM-dependent rRNA methyltransferase [Arcobacter sp. CECT 8985]|uniref:class I SAM-dependent rRNA methyltransferase n=1 Tax=Arcobacter sp. CECT 8985 TaxID=1935424 RepID=UPI00100BE637|nr:class I SAM-dependent rRNA methyltransferase [Arcobacter sp. CECT 8985]RXJ86392.1 RlmI/RlmK family 23S rRNA methyltransferase [Arcobacter sp. CECT 8985]
MNKTINLKIKSRFVEEYQDKYPLIQKEIFQNIEDLNEEGIIINLLSPNNKFIAKGYYGRQNKGYGWVLSYNKEEQIDKTFFINKIKNAITYRKDFYEDAKNNITTAFRVLNGEGDKLGGLTIDYFDGYYMLTWYSLGIYSFKNTILEALQEVLKQDKTYKGIYEKKRFDTKGQYLDSKSDFVCGLQAPAPIIVRENNVNFAVYLDDGAMTGIFLDQKDVRKNIRDKYANKKTMLNAFSYTGAFSIYAALGGAKKTTSVDLAKRSLLKTSEQFEVNNIDVNSQEIIVDDVFNYFKYAVKKQFKFDMVVLDPPSFARSKKITFSVSKDYVKLLKEAIQITNKNGIIVASTNSANFGIMKFRQFIEKAFKELKEKYEILETFSLPKDFKVDDNFRQGNYLKVVFIKKK